MKVPQASSQLVMLRRCHPGALRLETHSNGDWMLTLWFERAYVEHHTKHRAAYRMLLGRLGVELWTERGK